MPLVDVTDAFSLAPQAVTRYRTATAPYSAGNRTDGAVSAFSLQVMVEPAKGTDLMKLREGVKVSDVIRIFAEGVSGVKPLELATPSHLPDEVEYQGLRYRVEHVDDYLTVGGFVEALAVKKGL